VSSRRGLFGLVLGLAGVAGCASEPTTVPCGTEVAPGELRITKRIPALGASVKNHDIEESFTVGDSPITFDARPMRGVWIRTGHQLRVQKAHMVGCGKGKSAIHIARTFFERKQNFVGHHFWARGYRVDGGTRRSNDSRVHTEAGRRGQASGTNEVAVDPTTFRWLPGPLVSASNPKAPGFAGGSVTSLLAVRIARVAARRPGTPVRPR
jgi:hypothetical protein